MSPYRTARFRALGFDFAVDTGDAAIGRHLDAALGALRVPGAPCHRYSIDGAGGGITLSLDGHRLVAVDDRAAALSHLLWDVNRRAIEAGGRRHLVLHAAAAEHGGQVVVLPGPSGSGKTTLVAALVRAGLRYVTDEAVALGLDDRLVHPYAKPLDVDAGSWAVLADLAPAADPDLAPYPKDQWHLPPASLGSAPLASPAPAILVVAPAYRPGRTTVLVPAPRSHTLVSMAEQSFNFGHHGSRALEALAGALRRCRCFRLDYADLDRAGELVLAALEEVAAAGTGSEQ